MNRIPISFMFDMRAPAFGAEPGDLYAAALEMAAFGDAIGVDRIGVTEHHGSEDGYLPTPFVLGGGVAARTRHCRLTLGAVILPLHDPVSIAEQVAVLDLMSGGRLQVVLGAGYVATEFAAFGVSLRDRGRRMDEGLDIVVRALEGERFEANGRPVFVRPLPLQSPRDILVVGGGVEASARRAARYGLGFSPLRNELFELYDAECRRNGFEPGVKFGKGAPGSPISIHLATDPERAWSQLKPHALHMVSEYAKWAEQEANSHSPFAGLRDEAALRRSGLFAVWTPEELLAKAPSVVGRYGVLSFAPLLGGLAPELGWESLELLKAAMPELKKLERADA